MVNRKLVTISDAGIIRELGIAGPVRTPSKIPVDTIQKLVVAGYNVYEHNVADPTQKVKLTISNINRQNFTVSGVSATKAPEKEAPVVEESVKEETPVAEPEVVETAEDAGDTVAEEVIAETEEDEESSAEETDASTENATNQNSSKKKNRKRK
jgi:hypothetical protein